MRSIIQKLSGGEKVNIHVLVFWTTILGAFLFFFYFILVQFFVYVHTMVGR